MPRSNRPWKQPAGVAKTSRLQIYRRDVALTLNASLRGWVGYFHYRHSSKALGKVKTYAEDRLRNHLMKRHKIRNRGEALQRFPRETLYADYGLYKVPMTARWKSAHASV